MPSHIFPTLPGKPGTATAVRLGGGCPGLARRRPAGCVRDGLTCVEAAAVRLAAVAASWWQQPGCRSCKAVTAARLGVAGGMVLASVGRVTRRWRPGLCRRPRSGPYGPHLGLGGPMSMSPSGDGGCSSARSVGFRQYG